MSGATILEMIVGVFNLQGYKTQPIELKIQRIGFHPI